MKNISKILAITAAVLLAGSAMAQVAVEKVTIHRTGGKLNAGKFGYSIVEQKIDKEEMIASGISYWEINCEGQGDKACRFTLENGTGTRVVTVHGLEFDGKVFTEYYNKLLDKVDAQLSRGKTSGKVEEEIFLEYQGRTSDVGVRFTAIWENGNRNGAAIIALTAEDITK